MTDAELAQRIRERAYLEGDFVLRSGRRSRYYLDKYRFETDPELLRELGERIAAFVDTSSERPDRGFAYIKGIPSSQRALAAVPSSPTSAASASASVA